MTMVYSDGTPVKLGDTVRFNGSEIGRVVCSLDASEFADAYPAKDWSYLGSGILVETTDSGLIHLPSAPVDLRKTQR